MTASTAIVRSRPRIPEQPTIHGTGSTPRSADYVAWKATNQGAGRGGINLPRLGGAPNLFSIQIFQTPNGVVRLEVALEQDTVWLSQTQMVALFGRNQSVVSRHVRNALTDGEISEQCNMQKMHIAKADQPVTFYDLDVVISVGYRIPAAGIQP